MENGMGRKAKSESIVTNLPDFFNQFTYYLLICFISFLMGIFTLASISFICGIDIILLGKVFYENPKIAL
jgi:hypothetical protein